MYKSLKVEFKIFVEKVIFPEYQAVFFFLFVALCDELRMDSCCCAL